MKLYIDSRAVGNDAYNTLLEIYVNGIIVKKGILQMAEFCCVNLENRSIKELELKFYVITKEEGHKYDRFDKCDLKNVPDILELDVFEVFRKYDAETDLTIEDTSAPKAWVYAYSTKIMELETNPNHMIFVFDGEGVPDISICEVQGNEYNVIYERIISKDKIYMSFKEWKSKWIKRGLITLVISTILFICAVLLICSINWSPYSGKAQMSLLGLASLLFFVTPNGANILSFKDIIKTKKFLMNTEILDVLTFEKLKEKNANKSQNEDDD